MDIAGTNVMSSRQKIIAKINGKILFARLSIVMLLSFMP